MAEPKKLTQKEYDAIRSDYEIRYGYDSRSDEEKDAFDKKFEEHYQVEKRDVSGDTNEGTEKSPKKLLLTRSLKSITKSIKRAIQKMTIPMNRMKKSRMIVNENVVDVVSAK